MQKATRVLLLGTIVLLLIFSIWPSDSKAETAMTMMTESCGLENSNGNWDFAIGVNQRIASEYEGSGFPANGISLGAVSRERAVLAQRAAILDNRWTSLAEVISDVAVFTEWSKEGNLSQVGAQFALNGKAQAIKAYYLCQALKEDRNS